MAYRKDVPPEIISVIWQYMLDVARLNRYYAKMARRVALRSHMIRFVLAF